MKRLCVILLLVCSPAYAADKQASIAASLQDASVTIKSGLSQGSGVLFTRGDTTFVWTAGHVIDNLRNTREVIDPKSGTKRTVVEFKDAKIVQEYQQDGRRIGEINMDAKVLRYSDAETGEDLALLQIRKRNFTAATTKFYLEDGIPPVGTELLHVGSLYGQFGANSVTDGIISQTGRVLPLGANGVTFDQTTVTAFPGSSGGGVYLKSNGQYVGMLVRGGGATFNFIVPIRRMYDWAKRSGIEWALDSSKPMPKDEVLRKLPIEDNGTPDSMTADKAAGKAALREFPYLLRGTFSSSYDH